MNAAEKRAAVAALIRFVGADEPEVLLMRRANREGDRWSGQVSFPGGKEEPEDSDLLVTAMRETHEELGFSLARCSRLLGPLDPVQAVARGQILSTAISPFVFVQTRPAQIELGPEAARAFWLPLHKAASGALDSSYEYRNGAQTLVFPSWLHEGEVIWGLTFRMLQSLLRLVSTPGD